MSRLAVSLDRYSADGRFAGEGCEQAGWKGPRTQLLSCRQELQCPRNRCGSMTSRRQCFLLFFVAVMIPRLVGRLLSARPKVWSVS